MKPRPIKREELTEGMILYTFRSYLFARKVPTIYRVKLDGIHVKDGLAQGCDVSYPDDEDGVNCGWIWMHDLEESYYRSAMDAIHAAVWDAEAHLEGARLDVMAWEKGLKKVQAWANKRLGLPANENPWDKCSCGGNHSAAVHGAETKK